MVKLTRARLAVAGTLLALLFGFGVWVLLHPASIWVQPWRTDQRQVADGVIFGPYPTEEDFVALKGQGVTTVVSLLDPRIPYEKVLLAQERERAARHGMRLLNYPMGSILGQKFGTNYLQNSKAAAEAALASTGTAYIHCYLGLNRAGNVQRYLATLAPSRSYATAGGHAGDRDVHARAEDAFRAGRHAQVLAELATMQGRNAQALRMEAWSHYKLNQVAEARTAFERLLVEVPGDLDATTGLGYCALRDNRLLEADERFSRVLGQSTEDVAAIEGLGYVKFRQSQFAQATALFERALAANPGNPETRAMLARLARMPEAAAPSFDGLPPSSDAAPAAAAGVPGQG
jgi:tetratricopeptide (TPR) repeat protein